MKSDIEKFKVFRWKDGEKVPDNLTGHIVVFDDPLIVHVTEDKSKKVMYEGKKVTQIIHKPTGEKVKCSFMRVKGGFGAYKRCSGRMLMGSYFRTIFDAIHNKPFQRGNTKCFPDGFIPGLFTQHEKL